MTEKTKEWLAGVAVVGWLALIVVVLVTFFTEPAECQSDSCRISRCNAEIICPAPCGCVRAPGQPWGNCARAW